LYVLIRYNFEQLQHRRNELDCELTFHPQIISPSHLNNNSSQEQQGSVFRRLSTAPEKIEIKTKIEKIKSELTKDWTFAPQISENSKKLAPQRYAILNFFL
jgi:hypothetical protein